MLLTTLQLSNLELAAIAAVKSERETGCPADLTICQWALESGWGQKVPQASNNPFGIMVSQPFRTFPSLADAFCHHGRLIALGAPYGPAFRQYCGDHDISEFFRGVAKVYATDPTYADRLMKIGNMREVQDALLKAESS